MKRNQRNEKKPTKAKRNQLKQNEIDLYEENGRKKIRQNEIKKLKKLIIRFFKYNNFD